MESARSVPSVEARARPPARIDSPTAVLLTHFDALVDAAGSVKRFRELILHLAMQGKLSHHASGSVETLLAEVRLARQQLSTHGARLRDVPRGDDSDEPWPLPSGWRWVRLGELGGFLGGGTPSKANASFWTGSLPWVSPKDMKQPYIDDAEDHISMAAVAESAAKLIPVGSILCVVRGMILAHSFPVALTRREVAINQDMKALVLAMPALGEFVLRAMQAARARVLASVERSTHGTCRLDGEVVEHLQIPLPPLAEQKRIVAKVDQLMALCDDLEVRQAKKREIGTRLTKSALEALTTAESPAEFDRAWKRVLDNFDALFGHSSDVADLRKLLLELAMCGRLTEPKQGDGLGRDLLKREHKLPAGQNRRRKLFKEKREQRNQLRNVPDRWAVATVQELYNLNVIVDYADGNHGSFYPRAADFGGDGIPFVTAKNISGGNVDVLGSPRLRRDKAALLTKGWAEGGDVLLTHNATVGRVGMVPIDAGRFLLGTSATYYRLNPSGLGARFFAQYLMSPCWQEQLFQVMEQTTRNQVSIQKQADLLVLLPPVREQERITVRLDSLMQLCDELEERMHRAEDRGERLAEAAVRELVA